MHRRWRAFVLVGLMATAACTALPSGNLPLPGASPSAGSFNPLLAVGRAQQVRQELVDARAKAWSADAELVDLVGSRIDGTGVNSANDSKWVFTYRSISKAMSATFNASPAGLTGPNPHHAVPTKPAIGPLAFDSDEAILRYVTTTRAKGLDRFNLTLLVTPGGGPSWAISVVDEFGKTTEGGSVNASTGSVSVS